ncbi:LysR family transcriptional regulator [Maribrevibacterium harenarium]|uniref:LysR family transcriptional regulator n=1 Tax=Maribrevibacterium harenarium TaxID=2589817 RepID=A0A501WJF5_9GAMM|nr:LysR substrate-binding domain-containing protein [Maribrevibacterium harenarium]TPE49649.1 LysR family transcriptional regulator [Maribrevibacterium harenarium]
MKVPYAALYTLHLIARLGTLRQVSEQLHLTESAISHQIKRLESQLGFTLVYKAGRNVRLTPEARTLIEQLSPSFDHIDQVVKRPLQQSRSLTIFCLPSLLEPWLLPRLIPFQQTNPDINLAIRYFSSSPEYLDESSVRIGAFTLNQTIPNPVHKIFSGETLPVCSPIYLSQHNSLDKPEEFLQADLLHDQDSTSWQQWFADQNLTLTPHAQTLYEDFHLLKMATLAAQGIALCPAELIRNELEAGSLVALSQRKGNIGRYYGIEQNRYAQREVNALVEHLLFDKKTNSPSLYQ